MSGTVYRERLLEYDFRPCTRSIAPRIYFVGEGKNPVHHPDKLFEATVGNALFKGHVVTLDFHTMTFDVK